MQRVVTGAPRLTRHKNYVYCKKLCVLYNCLTIGEQMSTLRNSEGARGIPWEFSAEIVGPV